MKMDPKDKRPAKGMRLAGTPYQGISSGMGRGMALTRQGKGSDFFPPSLVCLPMRVPRMQRGTDTKIHRKNNLSMTRKGM
mmetsp:Transcript_5090/g.10891  ORF Transcript_5090/g.10891 Transcript_5090/m.10891 type:complete len:80 (-) Transcript_5090:1523-1762(-)